MGTKPMDPKLVEEKARSREVSNTPTHRKKTNNANRERNPRDQKGRGRST